ncbi:MAG: nucleotide exchange factor GrpE [Burkholderiaceae bacterium]
MSNPQADEPLKPMGEGPGGVPETPAGSAAGAQQAAPAGDPAVGAAPVVDPQLEALRQELAAAQAKASEHYDAYVRAHAEMENVRRRAQDDVAKAHKFSIESFAESLLPVRDSLEMALKTDNVSAQALLEGVQVTLKQLAAVFERNKLLVIDPAGQKFDPNLHQAISMVPGSSVNPPVEPNHVVSVLQKGYLINDRILRPALVTVAQS